MHSDTPVSHTACKGVVILFPTGSFYILAESFLLLYGHLTNTNKATTTQNRQRKKYNENWAGWHTPRHTSLFSPNNINLLLDKSGWKVSEVLTHGTLNPYLLFWMSEMEQKGIQWTQNMEKEFWNFVTGMLQFMPKKWNQKKLSLGVMTIIATPKQEALKN